MQMGPPEPLFGSLLMMGVGPGNGSGGVPVPPGDERVLEDGTARVLEDGTTDRELES
jgi:hypothetical protein